MVTATWKGKVIAKSDATIVIEGNHYFPPASIEEGLLSPSETKTTCGWKGVANYMNIVLATETNPDAVWFYPDPKPEASQIKGYFAFWKGVTVSADEQGADEQGKDQTPDSAVCEID